MDNQWGSYESQPFFLKADGIQAMNMYILFNFYIYDNVVLTCVLLFPCVKLE
jgi:hypothetical protein